MEKYYVKNAMNPLQYFAASQMQREERVEMYLATDVDALKARLAELEKALREAMTLIERARDFPDDIRGHIDDDIEDFKKEHRSLMERKT